MTGSSKMNLSTDTCPDKSGIRFSSIVRFLIVAMFATSLDGALEKETSLAFNPKTGKTLTPNSPSMLRVRPVASFAAIISSVLTRSTGTINGIAIIAIIRSATSAPIA